MTRDKGRNGTTAGDPFAIHGDTGSQHQGLGIDRLGQQFSRAFGNHLPEILAEGVGGLGEGLTDHRGFAIGGHHADRLGALPRKHESKIHRSLPLFWLAKRSGLDRF